MIFTILAIVFFILFIVKMNSIYSSGDTVLGITYLVLAIGLFMGMLLLPIPMRCVEVLDIQSTKWDKSPFIGDPNFVGNNPDQYGNMKYVMKTNDEYGSPSMVNVPGHLVSFIGVDNQSRASVIKYGMRSVGWICSFPNTRYLVVMDSKLLLSGENELALNDVKVYYAGNKGVSPKLKRWLGSSDESIILGLAEAPPKEDVK